MSKPIVHMIGQAHLDPVWLWQWTEGRAEALATSKSAADRLDEFPAFHFTRGEAQVYRWIEEEDPALFARVLEWIRAGRWHVVNGMVIQPDMNIPNGESFVRQTLLGKGYMAAALGVEPRVAYCVDSFGHAGTLPQVLRKCGFDAYVFMRPQRHEKELESNVFWWQAPDGSRLLTFRITEAYTNRRPDQTEFIAKALADKPDALDATMSFFGVGNHGGGPTVEQIEALLALAAERDDIDVRFSHPDAFFDGIAEQAGALPTLAEELQYHAVGCYSVNSELKRAHRQAENRLLMAERMAVLAALWTNRAAPVERLRELWWELCFDQFHDTLGGSSIKDAEDDAIRSLHGIIATCDKLVDDAGRAVAAAIDTRGPGGAVALFNPHAQAFEGYVEYEPWTDWKPWREHDWGLLDETGQPVPYQLLEPREATTATKPSISRLIFPAALPGLGYRVYRFAPDAPKIKLANRVSATEQGLENELIAVRLDPSSGDIVSCVDKATGLELVGPGGWNAAQVVEDTTDTWSHGVTSLGEVIGAFGGATVRVAENGPLQASLLAERSYERGVWRQQIVLRAGERDLLIRNWLVWQGHWRTLKLAFDVATARPRAVHDMPFAAVERPTDGREVPTQMWMGVSGPAAGAAETTIGAALLNDGKYGCDVHGSVMRLTVLRCTPYAYHEPHPFGSRQRYDWNDEGYQEFTVRLCTHVGDWRDAGIVAQARLLNMPVQPITAHSHAGSLPMAGSTLALEAEEIELTALKPAEDGDGYIVRLADRHGRGGSGRLRRLDSTYEVTLAPYEVATFRLAADGTAPTPCDMLERPL